MNMTDGQKHHLGPRPQTDLEAANSAEPDTDRPALWDDAEHERYILATDPEFYYTFIEDDPEAAAEAAWEGRQQRIERGDWTDDDEEEFLATYDDDEEECGE